MSKRFKGKDALVCVAVNFDDASKMAVKAAEQYCHRTGAELRLIHVCESAMSSDLVAIGAADAFIMPFDVIEAAEESAKEAAKAKMFDLAQSVKAPINVSTRILDWMPGGIAEVIESEAVSSRADIIFVGAKPSSHRFVPSGFSVALSLMSHAKVPVMVVNANQGMTLDSDRLSMVIADDLKPSSTAAVVGGCALAFALGKTDIFHLHVNGVTKDALKSALSSALAASHTPSDAAMSCDDVHAAMVAQLERKLENRTIGSHMSLEVTACRYHRDLLTEVSVLECLKNYVHQKRANLVVFGRHHGIHHKPFGIGQMPYYTMLSLGCPVLVFPTV